MGKATQKTSQTDLDFRSEELEASVDRSSIQELLRLMTYLQRHRGLFWSGVALILVATAAALFQPRLFGYAIDEAVIPKDLQKLKGYALLFLGVEVLRVVSMIAQSLIFTLVGQKVMQDLRLELLSHLQRLPVSTFDKNPAGRLVTRVTNDIGSLAEMFSAGFITILSNVLTVVGIMIWLFLLDFRVAVAALAVFPILMLASVRFSARLRVAYRDARSKLSAFNASLAENIMGIRVVQLFGREKRQLAQLAAINESYAQAQIGSVKVFALFQPAITLATGISMAAVISYGGHQGLAPGILVAFFAYVMTLFQPIREIADKWNLFLSGMASAERIFSILDWKVEVPDLKPLAHRADSGLGALRGEIQFENVWFAYEGTNWVLRDFSLHIRPGMKVGVVGHTGAGKSTLISLLLRFYEPQRGRILIDGIDLKDWDRRELRSRIGMIQQDVFLFSGTIAENVTLFKPGATGEGGERELYERGVNLSMGERQRIAFQRAKAAKPDLWILDEATSNVDSQTEAELARELTESSKGQTRLWVAHRLATVQDCDWIVVLHQGQCVESGKHDELVRLGGVYSKLVQLQSYPSSRTP
ncbi:MAG: ABC transporter ATP-binding protein [Oligoflexia bacterium]